MTRPTVVKLEGRPCVCCEAEKTSRKRRSNELLTKMALFPAAR